MSVVGDDVHIVPYCVGTDILVCPKIKTKGPSACVPRCEIRKCFSAALIRA